MSVTVKVDVVVVNVTLTAATEEVTAVIPVVLVVPNENAVAPVCNNVAVPSEKTRLTFWLMFGIVAISVVPSAA